MTARAEERAGMLRMLIFALLVGTLAARLLISETYYPLSLAFLGTTVSDGPTPALSVWLDWVLLAGSVAALLLPGRTSRLFVAGVALLALGVLVSSWAANDQRIALNTGAGMVCILIAAAGLARVVNSRRLREIAMAALLAGCAVNALKCVTQRAYEFRETYDFWKQEQAKLTPEQRAATAADPMVINYERRLLSNSAFGYLSHSNVTASCLAMSGAGLAWCIRETLRRKHEVGDFLLRIVVAGGLLSLTLTGLWGTDSNGGWIALLAGLGTLGLLEIARRVPAATPNRVAGIIAVGYLLLVGGLLAYGLGRGTLPSESLAFRWEYWVSGWRAWLEHPWTGCGRENFIDGYLVHKSAAATEEVKNPHGMWLTLLYENGPLGLLGGLLLCGFAVTRMARAALGAREAPSGSEDRARRDAHEGSSAQTAEFAPAVLAALVALTWAGAASELVRAGFSGALIWFVETGGAWIVALFLIRWLLRGTNGSLAPIALAAIVVALTHGLIDFALAVPSGLALLAGLVAVSVRPRAEVAIAPGAKPHRILEAASPFAIGAIALAHLLFVAVPTQRTTVLDARLADVAARGPVALDELGGLANRALEVDPLGTQVARSAAGTMADWTAVSEVPAQIREKIAETALGLLGEIQRRTPRSASPARTLARIQARLAELRAQVGKAALAAKTRDDAIESFEHAIALHPTDPRLRIEAAEAALPANGFAPSATVAARAVKHLDVAVQIDGLRKPDVAAKLTTAEQARIAADRAALTGRPASREAAHD